MSKEHHFRSYLSNFLANFLANHVLCLYVYISVNKTKAERKGKKRTTTSYRTASHTG